MNFLDKSTRPDISYATHQCDPFIEDPKISHAKAVRHIVDYLRSTKDEGLIIDPKEELLKLEVFADADWSGNYFKKTAEFDVSTTKSRTGFYILFDGSPVT